MPTRTRQWLERTLRVSGSGEFQRKSLLVSCPIYGSSRRRHNPAGCTCGSAAAVSVSLTRLAPHAAMDRLIIEAFLDGSKLDNHPTHYLIFCRSVQLYRSRRARCKPPVQAVRSRRSLGLLEDARKLCENERRRFRQTSHNISIPRRHTVSQAANQMRCGVNRVRPTPGPPFA
jgi:hypothetical protein